MIKHLCEQHSEAWYALREARITGTRFDDLMASKKTKKYQNLLLDIAAKIINQDTDDDIEEYVSESMENGTLLEPIARKAYEDIRGVKVEQVGFITPGNKYDEWIGVSPDGLCEDGMIEIKCPKYTTHLNYILNDQLPDEYYWQVYGQLYVTQLNWCDFVSYHPDFKIFIYRVYPDEKIFEQIEKELDIAINSIKEIIKKYNAL